MNGEKTLVCMVVQVPDPCQGNYRGGLKRLLPILVGAYMQALQGTTMILIDSIRMLAGPEFQRLMREELKGNPGERAN